MDWKITKDKSSQENLKSLLKKLCLTIERIIQGKLSGQEEVEERRKLAQALNDTGLSLAAIPLMQDQTEKKSCSALCKEIEKKTDAEVLATLLSLHTNASRLRRDSLQYDEAAPEIQAAYFVKLSLYQIELHRRRLGDHKTTSKKEKSPSPIKPPSKKKQ